MKIRGMLRKMACFTLALVLVGGLLPQEAHASYGLSGQTNASAGAREIPGGIKPNFTGMEEEEDPLDIPEKLDEYVSSGVTFKELKVKSPGKRDTFTRSYSRKFVCGRDDIDEIKSYVNMLCRDYEFKQLDAGKITEYKGQVAFCFELAYTGDETIQGSLEDGRTMHFTVFGTGTTSRVDCTVWYLDPIDVFSDQKEIASGEKEEEQQEEEGNSRADRTSTITMYEGDRVEIEGPKRDSASYELWKWEILEGSEYVMLSDEVSRTCTVRAKKAGEARIRVTYSYTKRESDVLTGRPVNNGRTIREDYVIKVK